MVMADRRKYAGRAVTILLAAFVATATAGCGNGDGDAAETPAPDRSPQESATVDPAPNPRTALSCGAEFTPPTGGGLYLTGHFPATAAAAEPSVTGTVEVNSPRAVRGVVGRRAEVFLVRDGRIATVPGTQDSAGVPLDLKPSQAHTMPGGAELGSCAALSPGAYQLYARVVFTPDGGTPVEAFGGPWPIALT
jgi:hypothetical protein